MPGKGKKAHHLSLIIDSYPL